MSVVDSGEGVVEMLAEIRAKVDKEQTNKQKEEDGDDEEEEEMEMVSGGGL